MADYTKAFEVDEGLMVFGGAGLFSGIDSPNFDAPIGSLYLKTDNTRYYKIAAGAGAENWLQDIPTVSSTTKLITEVYNNSGVTIPKGSVVYLEGSHGFLPTIVLAQADSEAHSATTYGLALADITDQGSGFVVHSGLAENLDTHLLPEGNQLYLSPTVPGGYTLTKPSAPDHVVFIGVCTRSHPTFGTIEVSIQNGYELDELHNVAALTPTNKDIIRYNSTTHLWEQNSDFTTLETAYNANSGMGLRIVPSGTWYVAANYESVITRRGYINGRLVLNGKLSVLF